MGGPPWGPSARVSWGFGAVGDVSLYPLWGDLCSEVLCVSGPVRHGLCRPLSWPGLALGLTVCPHVSVPGSWGAAGLGAVGGPPGTAGCAVMGPRLWGDVEACSSRCCDRGIREGTAVSSFPSWHLRRSPVRQPQAGGRAAPRLGGPRGRLALLPGLWAV